MQFLAPAAGILREFRGCREGNLKLLLSRCLGRSGGVDVALRPEVTRTVYGVVRHERLLEHFIGRFSRIKLKKIQPDVLTALKMGVYLLVFSDSYPDYAVVGEVVSLVGRNVRARGFVNAVLRRVAAQRDELRGVGGLGLPLDVAWSVTPELVRNLELISSDVGRDLEYLNREPVFQLRVNTRLFDYAESVALLGREGIAFREHVGLGSIEVKAAGRVLECFLGEGRFYFQGAASQAVSLLAARLAGGPVLDCCAAPGTKSVTLSLLRPELAVHASDINPGRVVLMKKSLASLGVGGVDVLMADARYLPLKNSMHTIIVDAPCTSSGTLRKNPDLKLKIDAGMAERMASGQSDIMKAVVSCFTRTQYIIYAVCSFLEVETEGIVGSSNFSSFWEPMDCGDFFRGLGFNCIWGGHGYYFLPDDGLNNDLFYISVLKSRSFGC